MSRLTTVLLVLCVVLGLVSGGLLYAYLQAGPAQAATGAASSGEEPELAAYMTSMQRYTHKLALSAAARNAKATGFYLHELEELNETIIDAVPRYEGYAIGDLTESMLVPQVEAVEAVLDDAEWAAVDARIDEVVRSCNQCHQATDHGFVQIEVRTDVNPFAQSFAPVDTSDS